jgi:hypothetical protein
LAVAARVGSIISSHCSRRSVRRPRLKRPNRSCCGRLHDCVTRSCRCCIPLQPVRFRETVVKIPAWKGARGINAPRAFFSASGAPLVRAARPSMPQWLARCMTRRQ